MLPVFLTLLCKVYFMRAVARTRRLYSASPIRPEWLIRAVHSREYLCIYLSPVFCGIHRDKPVDKERQFFPCGQLFFHPQTAVDDISRAAADDFAVIHRLHSLYDDYKNLSFQLRGFLCPSCADTPCIAVSSNKKAFSFVPGNTPPGLPEDLTDENSNPAFSRERNQNEVFLRKRNPFGSSYERL